MRSHPVGLDIWFFVRPFVYFQFMCANSEGSDETVRMRRLAWAFAGRLYDKYHNLMSWFKYGPDCWVSFHHLQTVQPNYIHQPQPSVLKVFMQKSSDMNVLIKHI